MKKLTALLLALVMVLAMNATAFAAADLPANGKVTTGDTELTIKKEVGFFAPDGTTINYPEITYTYDIVPVTGVNATIKDAANHQATVKDGVAGAVTMGTDNTAVIGPGSVDAKPAGTIKDDTFAIKVVEPMVFTSAGIYRYRITEAVSDMDKLGYEEATNNKDDRYLDVYIGNKADGSGLEVKGYVLFYNADANKSFDGTDTTTLTQKTEGFVHEDKDPDNDYSDDAYLDKYKAYNVTITKEVTGAMGDKNNPFPFGVAISDAPVTSDIVITVDDTSANSADPALVALANGEVTMKNIATLKHGQSVTIKGIPVGAKVSIKETNDTADTYTVSTEGLDTPVSGSVTGGTDSGVGDVKSDVVATKDVKFTNNLEDVSQTGVVLRFAPYALMLGAGIALFIILKVRKNKAVEEA